MDVFVHATNFSGPCTYCARSLETPFHTKTSQNGRSQTLSLPPTLKVLMSSCLYVLIHHNDSSIGSMSRSSNSSMMSFTMQINFSRLSLKIQKLSAHIIPKSVYSQSCCPPKDNPNLSLTTFLQLSTEHTWQHVPTVQVPPRLLGECIERA